MPRNNGRERKEARRKSANARRVAFEEAIREAERNLSIEPLKEDF